MPKIKKTKKSKNKFDLKLLFTVFVVFLFAFAYLAYSSKEPSVSKVEDSIYRGRIPCADCPGIEETLEIYKNNTYTDKYNYLERSTTSITNGTWKIVTGTASDPNAKVYELLASNSKNKSYFVIEGNKIRPLDIDLKELPPPYNVNLIKE